MKDATLLQHINDLVDEEHRLRDAGATSPDETDRLRAVQEQLDQCWDLLRQRRAKREFGADPDDAQVRDAGTVEGYTG